MRFKGFTIMELVIVVIIIGVIATLGLPAYKNIMEDADAKVCATNEIAIADAAEILILEQERVPGNLGEIPMEYIQRAYARLLEGKDAWKIKLAYALVDFQNRGAAFAQGGGLLTQIAAGNARLITCPKDTTGEGISYAFNPALAPGGVGISAQAYRSLPPGTIILGDSDAVNLTLVARHQNFNLIGASQSYTVAFTNLEEPIQRIAQAPNQVNQSMITLPTDTAIKLRRGKSSGKWKTKWGKKWGGLGNYDDDDD